MCVPPRAATIFGLELELELELGERGARQRLNFAAREDVTG